LILLIESVCNSIGGTFAVTFASGSTIDFDIESEDRFADHDFLTAELSRAVTGEYKRFGDLLFEDGRASDVRNPLARRRIPVSGSLRLGAAGMITPSISGFSAGSIVELESASDS
jgi:hypothetical protein